MKKKCYPNLVPSDETGAIWVYNNENIWVLKTSKYLQRLDLSTLSPHHLYITTDCPIKEGDWYLYNGIMPKRATSNPILGEDGNEKIVASTDEALKLPGISGKNIMECYEQEEMVITLDDSGKPFTESGNILPLQKIETTWTLSGVESIIQKFLWENFGKLIHMVDIQKWTHKTLF